MTLNLTVVTPALIYQSADFRLTSVDVQHSKARIVHDESGKLVQLHYENWDGCVTYTGIGLLNSTHLSEIVADWLDDGTDHSMQEVANLLAKQSTKLLNFLHKSTGTRHRHTFVLAGFEQGAAQAFMISNYQRIGQPDSRSPSGSMIVSEKVVGEAWTQTETGLRGRIFNHALVIATGSTDCLMPGARAGLRHLAKRYPFQDARIKAFMHRVNRESSLHGDESSPISYGCSAFSFRVDGTGGLNFDESAPTQAQEFPRVSFGRKQQSITDVMGISRGSRRLVGAFTASSVGAGLTFRNLPPCPTIIANEPVSGYVLQEIENKSEFSLSGLRDVSDAAGICGTANAIPLGSGEIPWVLSWGSSTARPLEYNGLAVATNSQGSVAAQVQRPNSRAGIYADGELHLFKLPVQIDGGLVATDSDASFITDDDRVLGNISDRRNELFGKLRQLPALFEVDAPVRVVHGVPSDHGARAQAIAGTKVLVSGSEATTQSWMKSTAGIWDLATDEVDMFEHEASIIANTMNSSLTVLGQTDINGKRLALLRRPGEDWLPIGTDPGWMPIDMNDRGDIVGSVTVEGFQRLWLRTASGTIHLLPRIRHHNHHAAAISNSGVVVGSASAGLCQHALVWRPLDE